MPSAGMNSPSGNIRWRVLEDSAAVAREVAAHILAAAQSAIAQRGQFHIVLAGGRTPEQAYRLLAKAEADWACWQIYFGDERCLPADHADRNSVMVACAWLNHVAIPNDNVYPIPAELGAETAAKRYAHSIQNVRPFDLVLLGMGEDGHTASLFPGQVHADDERVHAVHQAPKPPPDRVSLSCIALSDTRSVLVIATGAGKREALARWRSGATLPVAAITAADGVQVLLDQDAAG